VTYTETHAIELFKPAKRQLRDKVIEANLTGLVASINNKSLTVRGWHLEADTTQDTFRGQPWKRFNDYQLDGTTEYVYRMYLVLSFTREDNKKPETHEAASIIRTLAQRSNQPSFGKWIVGSVNGEAYDLPEDGDEIGTTDDLIGYADVEIPDDWDEAFQHLYGLDSHIARVLTSLNAGINSGWKNRFHAALIGPPGCGKSDICESLKIALGEDAVMKLDATATTAAGAIKQLTELEILPRVIIIEEIEKAPEAAMSFLLGVLDQRSEIRKVTARQTVQRDTKLLAFATVNDVDLFRKLQAGALASRFPNEIFFSRPSRETLALILTREVVKVDGDAEWIAPTLDYCEEHKITDPRKVISLCLCGMDGWLDGTFAKMLDDTSEPQDEI
jgi:hypothetical protein